MSEPKRKISLASWGVWNASNPWKAICIAFGITVVLTIGIYFLRAEMTFFSLMPESSRKVQDLKKVVYDFPAASSLIAVVDGRNIENGNAKEIITKTIEDLTLALSAEEFSDEVSQVYGEVDHNFIKNHGLAITKTKDLKRMKDLYGNPRFLPFIRALNNDLEREYSGDSEAVNDDQNALVSWVYGIQKILSNLDSSLAGNDLSDKEINDALDTYLLGDRYIYSRNEDMALLFISPTYTVNDTDILRPYTDKIEAKVVEIAHQNGVEAGLTGLTVVGRDEIASSQTGFLLSMLLSFVIIIFVMVRVLRIKATPFIVGIPLLVGLYWTAGLIGLSIQRLNMMTVMYFVALLGLGVDYAIHLLLGFIQARDRDLKFTDAIHFAFTKSGRGILMGALTSGAAFFALLGTETSLLRELGVVAGIGMLSEFLSMFILIPAFLGLRQRGLDKKNIPDPILNGAHKVESNFMSHLGEYVGKHPRLFLIVFLLITIGLSFKSFDVEIQDNLMEMEAKGLTSIELQDVMVEEFSQAPDVLYLLFDPQNANELPELIEKLEDLDSVKSVDSIAAWLPTEKEITERLPFLEEIQDNLKDLNVGNAPINLTELLDELYRLEANLIEMGDLAVLGGSDRVAFALNEVTGLNNDGEKVEESIFDQLFGYLEINGDAFQDQLIQYQNLFSPILATRVLAMTDIQNISKETLPESVRNSLFSTNGEYTLVSIVPTKNPWEGEYRNVFTTQVDSVIDRGTGLILVADQLTHSVETDTVKAVIFALIAVFFILLFDFRNLRLVIVSFLPLVFSFIALFGLMAIFKLKFDFLNLITIPLLIGIGIDDTIHINHRYLEEGKGKMGYALGHTGSAMALATFTTMIGFMSFIPSLMRAMRSTGIVLSLAMLLAFIYSFFFHSSVLIYLSEKWNWNLHPYKSKKNSKGE